MKTTPSATRLKYTIDFFHIYFISAPKLVYGFFFSLLSFILLKVWLTINSVTIKIASIIAQLALISFIQKFKSATMKTAPNAITHLALNSTTLISHPPPNLARTCKYIKNIHTNICVLHRQQTEMLRSKKRPVKKNHKRENSNNLIIVYFGTVWNLQPWL